MGRRAISIQSGTVGHDPVAEDPVLPAGGRQHRQEPPTTGVDVGHVVERRKLRVGDLCRGQDYADRVGEGAGQGRFGCRMLGIIRRGCCGSEGVEVCQEGVRCLIAAGGGAWRGDPREGPLFDGHVGVEVGLGRFGGGVACWQPRSLSLTVTRSVSLAGDGSVRLL